MITDLGGESLLKMILRGTTTDVAVGGNFYLGLCNHIPSDGDVLSSIVGEPTAAGGYARKAIERDATGFPTISAVNGVFRGRSKTVTWTPSGANFSGPVTRAFLCNAASGTVGLLFSFSGPLFASLTMLDGVPYPVVYDLYVK